MLPQHIYSGVAGACVGRVFAIPSLGNVGALHGRTDCDQYGLGPRAICGRGANGPAGDCLLCAKLLAPLGDLCRLSINVVLLHPANGPPAVPFHRGAARPGVAATPVDCKRKRKRGRSAGATGQTESPGVLQGPIHVRRETAYHYFDSCMSLFLRPGGCLTPSRRLGPRRELRPDGWVDKRCHGQRGGGRINRGYHGLRCYRNNWRHCGRRIK